MSMRDHTLTNFSSFTGAGRQAVHQLTQQLPPSATTDDAIVEICELARARDVRLLVNAEQYVVQQGIDEWTLRFQRQYNSTTLGKAIVYGTYQAYLHSSPTTLAQHLAIAQNEGFTLGVKLVRGAYLGSDARHLFWDTKEQTDIAYDDMAESVLRRRYCGVLQPTHARDGILSDFPKANLVIASHNQASITKAMNVREEQTNRGAEKIDLAYAQLMGMADEVSCGLVLAGTKKKGLGLPGKGEVEEPRAYKYFVWGTVSECLKYLVRRAEENRDAVVRAKEGRAALGAELRRRVSEW